MTESARGLERLLANAQIGPQSDEALRLRSYLALLEKWNARVNLTASTEWRMLEPLFGEGLWASRFYTRETAAHLDIGSGAGFPAILLRIFRPEMRLELVESRDKKAQFLETIAHTLGLEGTRVHHRPLADFLAGCGGRSWDCFSWKALKLKTADLRRLETASHPGTQIWMFHGSDLALEDGREIEGRFQLVRREMIPGMRASNLSIYGIVSRETTPESASATVSRETIP